MPYSSQYGGTEDGRRIQSVGNFLEQILSILDLLQVEASLLPVTSEVTVHMPEIWGLLSLPEPHWLLRVT